MNDGDYPRRLLPPDFDLMARAGQHRPGDRSRREDDRYMFLEALLSARDVMHISWVGHSVRDNSELPPSVLVGQLRDYLAAGWRVPGDAADDSESRKRLLAAITTTHPLQAFSPRYFSGDAASPWFTYASEWARARRGTSNIDETPLPAWQTPPVLDIAQLQRFLHKPATSFYAERLKVRFSATESGLDDDEPFALDRLESHTAADILLQSVLGADQTDAWATLGDAAQWLRQQGVLPVGGFGALTMEEIGGDVRRVLKRWHAAVARWPQVLDARELSYTYSPGNNPPSHPSQPSAPPHRRPGEGRDPATVRDERHWVPAFAGTTIVSSPQLQTLHVEGWLDDLRTGADHTLTRLLPIAGNLRQGKNIRYDKLLHAWVLQLLANANGIALTTHLLAADAAVALKACAPAEAATEIDALLVAWHQGMQTPLPIARRTAYAWLIAERAEKEAREAAQISYEGSDAPKAPPGEVELEPALARTWPTFSALHADGFEHWLPLYRPLLDAAMLEGAA
jgi:exodeoxyribonuclease V gamma subunit